MNEFKIIEKYFMPLARMAQQESLGLKDDCAIIQSENQIVINVDSIIEGEHFFATDPAASVAHKLLNVNLSDIAAMGATPKYWTLAISIPRESIVNEDWLKEFCNRLEKIQNQHKFYLISGDTTFGKQLTLTANIFAEIQPSQTPLRKSTAQMGDIICVSGCIGDSYWGLQLLLGLPLNISQADKTYLINKYHYPQARLELGQLLINYANSATDISDGLWLDVEKLCKYSGICGVINVENVPLSAAVRNITAEDKVIKSLTGGDDYELVFTISENKLEELQKKNFATPITKIGYVKHTTTNQHVEFYNNGVLLHTNHKGYNY
ncbi:MAG: thiamine-phosphate kinase [Alphaproteobacteria bacterium]|jgi:thiamine-monophosphate kinase|nr:thiamine-phosphate kinase [Alphaproteobacteria bacterium]